ncbi:MAG: hypothetical protein ACJAT2_000485 [Bacteriovoracaceae bacterium]
MKLALLFLFLSFSICYAEDLGAEDKEILKQLEFFSNLELLEDDVDLEDLDKMEIEKTVQNKTKGLK